MNLFPRYAAAVAGVVQRDFALFVSYRTVFFTQCLSLAFSVTLFYYLSRLVTIESFGSPDRYFEFVLIGMVILQAVTATLATLPGTVRQELVAGTLERLVLSPFGAVGGVLAMVIFPFIKATIFGMVMIAIAMVAYGLELQWPTALLAFPVAALGALAFTPFSLLFTAAVFAFKQAPGTGFVLSAVTLVSGMYFPVELLPGWIQWASEVQPFTPSVDLMRHLLVGRELDGSAWLEVARLVGFGVVLLPVGVVAMWTALRFAQRRGTVTEY